MKVFISQGMSNIPEEQVLKTREALKKKFMENYQGDEKEVEFISTYVIGEAPDSKNVGVHLLGRALQLLAECDLCIAESNISNSKGCIIEKEVCSLYGIEYLTIPV